jgi:hypothetical protein
MIRGQFFLLSILTIGLCGCASVSVTTSLHADGSYDRHVVYTVKKSPDMTAAMGGGANSASMTVNAKSLFDIPVGGVKSKSKNGDDLITVNTKVSAGKSPAPDIRMLNQSGDAMLKSTVSVTTLPNGDVSYDETLWSNEIGADAIDSTGVARAKFKGMLPERYRTDTKAVNKSFDAIGATFLRYVFGPPYPHLFDLMTSEDAASLYMLSVVSQPLDRKLAETLPGSTGQERRIIMSKIFKTFTSSMTPPTAGGMAAGAKPPINMANPNDMTPLTYKVAFPGAVVSTDGLFDPVSGDVFWSLYPPAASPIDGKPLHLHLVVRPTGK